MINFRKENFASFDEFMSLSDCKLNTSLRDVLKAKAAPIAQNKIVATSKVKEEKSRSSLKNDFVTPFARSSKRVQRSNAQFDNLDENDSDHFHCLPTEKYRKQLSLENIGSGKGERSNGGIRYSESKPFPSGIFGSKVVSRAARNHSPQCSAGSLISFEDTSPSDSGIISVEDLPHPSKLRKRKRSSTRQKRSVFEVDAHLALLKRKHAEFNWTPKGPISTSSCSDTEDVLPQEGMLQKVPNTSPPFRRNSCLSDRTPQLYTDSPRSWPKYHDSGDSSFPTSITTIQDQLILGTGKGHRDGFEAGYGTSDEDFHLNVASVPNSLPNFINNSDNLLPTAVPTCWAVELQDSVKEE